jgi:hypothetical protein
VLLAVPMAGLEPARAFYGPTDFKSVASAISPHRQVRFNKQVWPIIVGVEATLCKNLCKRERLENRRTNTRRSGTDERIRIAPLCYSLIMTVAKSRVTSSH